MANRSLGTLTLDLIAKIGGFVQGMDRAAVEAEKSGRKIAADAKKRAKETEEAWKEVGTTIGVGIAAGIGVAGLGFANFVAETKQAEQEQAQLLAVLKSTGEGAGWSADRLNDMADAMAKQSTFGAGDINQAQTRLLSYTGVVGEQFPRAMQVAIDMATRLGTDVPASAEAMGKALDSPKDGLEALSKQGFRFTEDQKALVEQLQKTGKTAEAQNIILTAVESAYGGAAAAARDTFGGALSALQENINDLLTGDEGSMAKLKGSVETLNSTLTSPDTKQAFQTFTGWMTGLAAGAVRTAAALTNLFAKGDAGALMLSGDDVKNPQAALDGLERQIAKVKKLRDELDPANGLMMKLNQLLTNDFDDANAQLALMTNRADALRRLIAVPAPGATGVPGGPPPPPPLDATGAAARAKAEAEAAKAREAAAKKAVSDAKAQWEAGQKFVQGLNDQIAKTQELTAAEDLLRQVRDGSVKLDEKQLNRALGLATALDMAKDMAEAKKKQVELDKEGYDLARSLMTPMEQLEATQERLNLLREEGAITQQTWDRAFIDALNKYAEAVPGVKKALSDVDEFTLQASRNIQDSLGGTLRRSLEGDFKSIGSLWKSTLLDMAAQAMSANLNKYLFGSVAGGGAAASGAAGTMSGGAIGEGISWLKNWWAGFDEGGYTGAGGRLEPAGIVHKGEIVWSQSDIAKAGGVGTVERMRLGGYADGGVVGSVPYAMQADAGGAVGGNRTIVNNYGQPDQVSVRQQQNAAGGMDTIVEVLKQQIAGSLANDVSDGVGPLFHAIQGR